METARHTTCEPNRRIGDVRTVTMDRSDRRDAWTPAGLNALGEAIEEASQSEILLRVEGDAFLADPDIGVVGSRDRVEAAEFARLGQRVASRKTQRPTLRRPRRDLRRLDRRVNGDCRRKRLIRRCRR